MSCLQHIINIIIWKLFFIFFIVLLCLFTCQMCVKLPLLIFILSSLILNIFMKNTRPANENIIINIANPLRSPLSQCILPSWTLGSSPFPIMYLFEVFFYGCCKSFFYPLSYLGNLNPFKWFKIDFITKHVLVWTWDACMLTANSTSTLSSIICGKHG